MRGFGDSVGVTVFSPLLAVALRVVPSGGYIQVCLSLVTSSRGPPVPAHLELIVRHEFSCCAVYSLSRMVFYPIGGAGCRVYGVRGARSPVWHLSLQELNQSGANDGCPSFLAFLPLGCVPLLQQTIKVLVADDHTPSERPE